MKKLRFKEEQMVKILREADRANGPKNSKLPSKSGTTSTSFVAEDGRVRKESDCLRHLHWRWLSIDSSWLKAPLPDRPQRSGGKSRIRRFNHLRIYDPARLIDRKAHLSLSESPFT